jgi:uncharacterized membrane protein
MTNLYRVVFTGRLRNGITAEQAARDFASVFKVPDDKAWKLVLDGKEHVLKKEVDQNNAERYMQILEEIGLEIRIDPIGSTAPPPLQAATAAPQQPQAPVPPPKRPQPAPRAAPDRGTTAWGSENPYAPPAAELTPPSAAGSAGPMTGPVKLEAGHGWSWIAWAFQDHFRQAPGIWIGAFLVLLLVSALLSLIPFIGGLIYTVLGPIFLGGLMYGAQRQDQGQRFEFNHLFEGFSRNSGRLAAVGGLYLLGILVTMIIAAILGGVFGALLAIGMDPQTLQSDDPNTFIAAMGPVMAIIMLIVVGAMIPIIMAYWFAPALVMLDGMKPVEAMKLSFTGCLRNVVPFLIYGLASFGLIIIAMLPLFLGLLILSPILMASMYTAYRDIYYGPRR